MKKSPEPESRTKSQEPRVLIKIDSRLCSVKERMTKTLQALHNILEYLTDENDNASNGGALQSSGIIGSINSNIDWIEGLQDEIESCVTELDAKL